MARVENSSPHRDRCENCFVDGENIRLCYCKAKFICSKDCWSALCIASPEYRLKCEAAMSKAKSVMYSEEAKKRMQELKSIQGYEDKYARDPDSGQFLRIKTNPTAKDKAKNDNNAAWKQKELVLKHIDQYVSLKPHNQLAVREIRPNGRALYWYKSPEYDPITAKTHTVTAAPSQPPGDIRQDEQDQDFVDVENRNPDEITQERRDVSRTYCSLCHEAIGAITGRLKCNGKACKTKSSIHLSCAGFFPSNATDRKIIQKSYFCKLHKPVAGVADTVGEAPEQREEDDSIPAENIRESQINKPKASKKTPDKVKISLDFAAVLAPFGDIPSDRTLSPIEYKDLFKKYMEQKALKDPKSPLYLLLDESLSKFVGETSGSRISLVSFKKKILKSGHFTNVSDSGEGSLIEVDFGVEPLPHTPAPVIEILNTSHNADLSVFPNESQGYGQEPQQAYTSHPPSQTALGRSMWPDGYQGDEQVASCSRAPISGQLRSCQLPAPVAVARSSRPNPPPLMSYSSSTASKTYITLRQGSPPMDMMSDSEVDENSGVNLDVGF